MYIIVIIVLLIILICIHKNNIEEFVSLSNNILEEIFGDPNKTVCIVGNAPIKKKLKNIINSCDVVIRFNDFETKKYHEFVGNKTNIWFTGLGFQQKIRDSSPCEKILVWSSKNVLKRLQKKIKNLKNILIYSIINDQYIKNNKYKKMILNSNTIKNIYKLNNTPTSGFACVILALNHFKKDIIVTGFGKNKNNSEYLSHYFNHNTKNLVNHDFEKEYQTLLNLHKNKKIKFIEV